MLSAKSIIAWFVSAGGVVGSSYGVFEHVSSRNTDASKQKTIAVSSSTSSFDNNPSVGEEEKENPETTSAVGAADLDAEINSQDLTADEEEDFDEDKVSGRLFVVKESDDSLDSGYQLKAYFGEQEHDSSDEVIIKDIPFKAHQVDVNGRINSLKSDVWGRNSQLSEFLIVLEEKRADLGRAFEDSVLNDLIEKVREKSTSLQ
ncbi:hypothetical protein MHLP_02125 [Candidatus Mycoplasma haematolamae str. Purdue]|uniref:Uncharacterized protein n=1 Tax=Mycoplasma haematolamae (strain Purdue) TaxID=1212765 RepID=I7B9S0_MYCHA|nr:hypothetical protein [Candidatus Mycoplasma haematolamae]AFO52005.1 hypothetical protein MHLP_02125 [Candidatus Mycoplasma haematolamae str. Purdue]